MATKLKELKLDDAHATAILEKAIEYESFTEDMPASKRDRLKGAQDQIALMIDAWNTEPYVTPDNEDEEIAAMGEAIAEIFEIAGVEIDDEGAVTYVEPGEVTEVDGGEEPDEAEHGETAFDMEDVIEGYDDLSAASKVKAIKKLELDMEDDDDYNTAVGIYEYEEAQDAPSSRVLSFLDDLLPAATEDEDGEAETEDEEDEGAEDGDEDAEEAAGGEWEEPWTKATGAPANYDKMTAVEVKKYLDKLAAKDELTADMAQYVIDYETAREKPPTRKRITEHAARLMAELEGEPEPEEPEEEEEAPARPRSGRPKNAAKRRAGRRAPVEEEPEPEPASVNGGGVFVISGAEENITAYGIYGAMGTVADLLAAGYEEVTVTAG